VVRCLRFARCLYWRALSALARLSVVGFALRAVSIAPVRRIRAAKAAQSTEN
jgi:hypothetical protein